MGSATGIRALRGLAFALAAGAAAVLVLNSFFPFFTESSWQEARDIRFIAGTKEIRLFRRGGSDQWEGESWSGLPIRAEFLNAVREFIRSDSLPKKVSEFPPGAFADADPGLTISFFGPEEMTEEWRVGSFNPVLERWYVRREPMGRIELRASPLFTLLREGLEAQLNTGVFRVSRDSVEQFTIQPRNQPIIHFRRTGESWEVNGRAGDRPFVSALLEEILSLKIDPTAGTERSEIGISNPSLSLFLKGKDDRGEVVQEYVIVRLDGEGSGTVRVTGEGSAAPGRWVLSPSPLFSREYREDRYLPAEPFSSGEMSAAERNS